MFTKTEEKLFTASYKGIPGVYVIDNGIPGPTVAIVGVTHGNEISGFDALAFLLEEMRIEEKEVKGRVFLVVHNLEAYKAFRINSEVRELADNEYRYIDINLNRIYSDEHINNPNLQNLYEINRAKEIASLIPEWDYILDIHSTSRPSAPMLIAKYDDEEVELGNKLFFYRHIYNIFQFVNGDSMIDFAKSIGKRGKDTVAIAVETGSHFLASSKYCAKKTAVRFLQNIGSTQLMDTQDPKEFKSTKFIVQDNILPKFDDFKWTQEWEGFQEVKKGTVIARENNQEIKANDDYVLLMPDKHPRPGGDGVYLAKPAFNS